MALHYLRSSKQYVVGQLFTTINSYHHRVSMHGLRRELMEAQVAALGLPHTTVELPEQPTMEEYNSAMQSMLEGFREQGFTHCAFGDIFLEDLRIHREQELAQAGFDAVFPIWKRDTRNMLKEFINLGYKAVVVSCDARLLGESFVGREVDRSFLTDLPANVDPCGENGEFHTFCYDGPIFNHPVAHTLGERVYQEYQAPKENEEDAPGAPIGFWFIDVLPG